MVRYWLYPGMDGNRSCARADRGRVRRRARETAGRRPEARHGMESELLRRGAMVRVSG
jgi:hypothetical protein